MGFSSRLLRLPRPQTFLYTMSLRTGAELITLSLLVNKLSGLYGLLALLTGYHLNTLQLSMYIYSLLALALTAFLAPHIRRQSPLQCLALAWFYVIDSVINAVYTICFSITWFLVISQHHHGEQVKGPGAGTIGDTAGFTNPQNNVSEVHVEATPASGIAAGQDAVAAGTPASVPAGQDVSGGSGSSPSLGHGVLQPESMNSIGVICTLWTVRLYFCVIMLAWARSVLRQYIAHASLKNNTYTSASTSSGLAENPFSDNKPEGQGWQGKLGRFMVNTGRQYWLGRDDDDDSSWMYGMGNKFRRSVENQSSEERGPTERERRRRSGTGPPQVPAQGLINQHATAVAAANGVKMQDMA
ncbi:hypothetical protein UCRPC4_g03001 [Phaeomoniella chlamydospora]|uniref:Inositol phoshorylceramide synthase regulatory subunit kei1 n=1 Tax=Phaeomoniella chlamydospora TaxID=158046 RepID=A0A0G2ELH5_PHACM|nr:hypothetical protein UCRPC4_g03001 [Phaeomoniella chlamydospora]